jgi:hypothetical protein
MLHAGNSPDQLSILFWREEESPNWATNDKDSILLHLHNLCDSANSIAITKYIF